jgi:hypothetical protein
MAKLTEAKCPKCGKLMSQCTCKGGKQDMKSKPDGKKK